MSRLIERIQALRQDFRLALRMYRNSPGFSAAAIVALALGIGASTAIFSVVNAVLLKPVAFAEPSRLVLMMISSNDNPLFPSSSPAQFVHFTQQTDVLEDVAAFRSVSLNYVGGDTPVRIDASQASEGYFRALRTPFAGGRGFAAPEDLPGAERVAVISHGFWTQYLGANPSVIGTRLLLSGDPYTVVGITSQEFDAREVGAPQVWVPLQGDPNTTDRGYTLQVVARLRPGITLAQAQSRLEASVAGYLERFPGEFTQRGGFSMLPLQEATVNASTRTSLLILVGAVALVLLIACANVANLLLVRAGSRRQEFAIRAALGAARGRIVQQLLAEGVLLSLVSGALGLAVGFLGMRTLLAVDTAGLPRLGDSGALAGLDWRVVTFAVGISLTTAILSSLAPALTSSRVNLVAAINAGARGSVGARQGKLRSALVVAEISLAALLLVGAALLIRTSLALHRIDAGFDAENLFVMQTAFGGASYAAADNVADAVRLARERVRALPGVVDAVATWSGVPTQTGWNLPFNIPGRVNQGVYTGGGAVAFTSPGYFETLGIRALRGRTFDERDDASAAPVAIVNEALARQYWPDADPFTDQMLVGGGAVNMRAYGDEPPRRIVGIVSNVRASGLADDPGPVMYVPQAQLPDAFNELVVSDAPMAWIVRTQGNSAALARLIQEELRLATGLPVTNVRAMEEIISSSISRQNLHTLLMMVFAGSALLLATTGIYGLMAYVVQQRTHEIGIRMAVGADPGRVRNLILRQGALLVALGVTVGLVAAYYVAAVLSSVLFEVQARDPAVFAAIPLVLILASLPAVVIPALRAGRVDPLTTARNS